MNLFEIKKVENCISKSSVYQYRFSFKLEEDLINNFTGIAEIKIHKNFPKPSFNLTFPDGTKIIGVINDIAFKAMFPADRAEESKISFEQILTGILVKFRTGE